MNLEGVRVSAELRAQIIRALAGLDGYEHPNTDKGGWWDRRIEPVFQVVQPILDERDAAIRRAANVADGLAISTVSGNPVVAAAIDTLRAALRSQESQKPPADNEAAE